MGETSKHAASKHKRKEHRLTEKALARDGADRLAAAAKKREASETAARKAPKQMRQFRRLQRIQLKTSAARTVPPDFMRRMIAAHRECPWTRHSEAAIVHHGSCGIRHGKACSCVRKSC
jgi:hypothetical protein